LKNLKGICHLGDRIILETGLKETGYESMDWIHQAQDRVKEMTFVNMVMNVQFP
jgi:hypothetical protein